MADENTKEEKPKSEVVTATYEASKTSKEVVANKIAAEAEAARVAAAEAAKAEAEEAAKKAEELKGDLPKPTEGDPEEKSKESSEEGADGDDPNDISDELDTDAFGDTGSKLGNSVLALIQKAGGTPEQARSLLFDAVQANDMSKIDTAALTELVGEDSATIILAGAKTYAQDVADQNSEITKQVTSAVGSAENWTAIQTWVDASDITDSEKAEYNELIASGGAKARFAATELLSKYNADKGNTEITDTSRVNADVDTDTESKATTVKEYLAEMKIANRRGLDTTAIKAARARGRAKGI